jgi:hypothetical protein
VTVREQTQRHQTRTNVAERGPEWRKVPNFPGQLRRS